MYLYIYIYMCIYIHAYMYTCRFFVFATSPNFHVQSKRWLYYSNVRNFKNIMIFSERGPCCFHFEFAEVSCFMSIHVHVIYTYMYMHF